ncbi:MAG: hypothetical protein NTZ12_05685 [Candidatus Aminicenantes bacterium]|nr:hypothetical protein [Candidatus Aminicenantes bacterium]
MEADGIRPESEIEWRINFMKSFKQWIFPAMIFFLLIFFSSGWSESGSPWKELHLKSGQSLWASSELVEIYKDRTVKYSVKNIFDHKTDTCWAEGVKGNGIGENITIVVNKDISRIGIINGNATNPEIYRRNNRIKKLKCYMFIAFTAPGLVSEADSYLYFMKSAQAFTIDLNDSPEMQYFDFPVILDDQHEFRERAMEDFINDQQFFFEQIEKELGVRKKKQGEERKQFDNDFLAAFSIYGLIIEIEEVFSGSKYQDTCISEIKIEMI